MSEKHPLEDLEFTTQEDENGVVTRVGDQVVGNISPSIRGESLHNRTQAALDASTQADADEYERLMYEDPDFETVKAEMRQLAGQVDEKEASRINSDYRTFVREYYDLKNRMVGQQIDAPRQNEIARLREQLRAEDEQTGCRQTARRQALVERIARLHGGGR